MSDALGPGRPLASGDAEHGGNSAAHVKARMMGSSVYAFGEGGRLQLGVWQGIYLCEFDGPRTRMLWIH